MVVGYGWLSPPPSLFGQRGPVPWSRRRRASGSAHTCTQEDMFQGCVVSWMSAFAHRKLQRGDTGGFPDTEKQVSNRQSLKKRFRAIQFIR